MSNMLSVHLRKILFIFIVVLGGGLGTLWGQDALSTIGTMAELRHMSGEDGAALLLLGYHAIGDHGGGLFYWQPDSVKEDNGGTVIAAAGVEKGRWIRQVDDIKVTYFGARGDGESDDTTAIQAAINAVSETSSPGIVYDKERKVGGTVHFPKGKYCIRDTLLVGPLTVLEGVGSTTGFQRRGILDNDQGSVIIAQFEDPNKWIISSAVYYRGGEKHGQLIPYRTIITGKSYDQVLHSRVDGVRIQNLLIVGKPNTEGEVPYGGVRLQACPGAMVQGVGVFGVDVGYMFNAGWGLTMRDCFSGSNLYGVLALYAVNGLHIDSCYINGSRTDRLIDDQNVAPGDLSVRGKAGNMPDDYPYKKVGILTQYGHNVTMNNVITEHWDIARFYIHGAVSDTGSWLEGNKELCYALVDASLELRTPNIHAPQMIREGRFMRAGNRVRAVIGQCPAFPITYGVWEGNLNEIDGSLDDFETMMLSDERFLATTNRITVLAADPDRQGWKYYPQAVSYVNARQGWIRVAADGDEAIDNTALADTASYVDWKTAKKRIEHSNTVDWTIELKEGAHVILGQDMDLEGKNLRFVLNGVMVKEVRARIADSASVSVGGQEKGAQEKPREERRMLVCPPGGDANAVEWIVLDEQWVRNYYNDDTVTMTDTQNGLMWVYDAGSNGVAGCLAGMKRCESLTYADYDDWFLPTREQLCSVYPALSLFDNIVSGWHWSSTFDDAVCHYGYVVSMDESYQVDYRGFNLVCLPGVMKPEPWVYSYDLGNRYSIWPCRLVQP